MVGSALDIRPGEVNLNGNMLKMFRIAASLLIVTLVVGLAADGVRATEMAIMPVVSMAGDASMPNCDGCDSCAEAAAVCAVYCSSSGASTMSLPSNWVEGLHPDRCVPSAANVQVPAELREAPDPFPPKSLVLS
jgi:hypothetical protein